MSALDFRRVEPVQCAGISISTFLSDDRNHILVSVDDLIDQLGLNAVVEDIDCGEYVAYAKNGTQVKMNCILHTDINEVLWMHDCSERNIDNLIEFRKFFMFEVIAFWNRFEQAAASLSVREAVKLIDHKVHEYNSTLGLPLGRTYEMAFTSLGYDRLPRKDDLTTEEYSYVALAELLYASVAASEQAEGASVAESMRVADMRLERPLKELGYVTRGISGV